MTDASPIGHNMPVIDEAYLREHHKALLAKVASLKETAAAVPSEIKSPQDLEKAARFMQIAKAIDKEVTDTHKDGKEPHKKAGDAYDKVFLSKGAKGEIDTLMTSVRRATDAYQTALEKKRREEAEAQAQAAAEAERQAREAAEAAAQKGSHHVAEVLDRQADAAAAQAAAAADLAQAPAKDLVRSHTSHGVTVGGRKKWVGEIEDAAKIDLNKLRDYLPEHELQQLINRYVDAGGRDLPGVNIYEKTISTFR